MNEFRCSIEYRADASRLSPGRLVGTLMVYGQRARDRAEEFARGSLTWPDGGIVLNRQHQRGQPILRFTPELVGDELRIDVALPDTTAGRDAAAEVREGLMTDLSVEFRARREERVGGVRVIREAILGGAALVDSGSYGHGVAIRQSGGATVPQAATLWL